jgi:hypothetical protein
VLQLSRATGHHQRRIWRRPCDRRLCSRLAGPRWRSDTAVGPMSTRWPMSGGSRALRRALLTRRRSDIGNASFVADAERRTLQAPGARRCVGRNAGVLRHASILGTGDRCETTRWLSTSQAFPDGARGPAEAREAGGGAFVNLNSVAVQVAGGEVWPTAIKHPADRFHTVTLVAVTSPWGARANAIARVSRETVMIARGLSSVGEGVLNVVCAVVPPWQPRNSWSGDFVKHPDPLLLHGTTARA